MSARGGADTTGVGPERLCHSKGNVSQLLDKMEGPRWCGGSARTGYGLHLTMRGANCSVGSSGTRAIHRRQFTRLTPAEQCELFRLVGKLDAGSGVVGQISFFGDEFSVSNKFSYEQHRKEVSLSDTAPGARSS
jgi:hypothetical protein